MNKAFVICLTEEYGEFVYLVFAETEKEAKQKLYEHTKSSWHKSEHRVVMPVMTEKHGTDIVELGGYLE